ncbi:MAG: AmmeMemoRadiSam system radical SAM enzyme [Gammaproteobacteria bacterium GWE2_37_16]|nr:MAG: AmmeMemoRadiSam system radical SAM enzyme [Gammaproteobacteria bacterium GWE2_37_16]
MHNTTTPPQYFPTKYWHKLDDDRIQCDICPNACKLKEGQHGICFVRMRHDDQVVLTTYGRASSVCIDPVEKKPLFHFLPGTPVLSFGTIGCNLSCKFCQNWDISKSTLMERLTEIAMPETIAETAKKYNCKSVAFTYNEPITFFEYAIDTAKACHKRGIKTIAVTNGYICQESAKEFFNHMDATTIGLKGFTEDFYHRVTGAHLQPILDTLRYLKKETNVWVEIAYLIIPGESDSMTELDLATKWFVENLGQDIPVHFNAFYPAWKMLDKSPTPKETLIQARKIAKKNGLRHVYIGNVAAYEDGNTFCHNCGKCVIERDNYIITDYKLTDDGNCKLCNAKCAGVFRGPAGTWGTKQQPVFFSK